MSTFGRGAKSGNTGKNNPPGREKENPNSNKKYNSTPTEAKFKEAQLKLQAAVEKYAQDYESSSSEDELESEHVIESILKNYSEVGGKTENLGRTQAFLEDTLSSGAATCLICIGSIKRVEKIWSCISCYCFFHLQCIERWSKDSIVQQKESLREQPHNYAVVKVQWGCPKCRFEYSAENIPREYFCFCGKTINPPFHPWLVPHSCGETCGKKLKPFCGHDCTLLCHPGPCPPCPNTVSVSCYCQKKPAKLRRCSNKEWSCGSPCNKILSCGKHPCKKPCHAGLCLPCSKKSTQKCQCGAEEQLTECATPVWKCKKICGRKISCGYHWCDVLCHAGDCGDCVLTLTRFCPCGKSSFKLPCTEETPTCGDTCGKLLECGVHTCNQRCHKDKCGFCLEMAIKVCRCGLHEKEVQCKKQFLCETKCKRLRDCQRHPCNRKCCDGACPPCEKPCGRTLPCGLHKCLSVCHRGPCYPCTLTSTVRCRCGGTFITVPCGRKKRTRPPRCIRPCKLLPDCHHATRKPHRCHFGDCPACNQPCDKELQCKHRCQHICHTFVLIKVGQKASMPWEQGEMIERKCLPCPDCEMPVSVTCLGGHETSKWPCHSAKSRSCFKPCGRELSCGNHFCQLECHTIENADDSIKAGTNCEQCENPCSFNRPEGCQHNCPLPCHPGICPPCKQILRLKCHCGLNQSYVNCADWTAESINNELLQSCGNQCPKNYACGHRCKSSCHSGLCPNAKLCKKKVKVFCNCKRIKKEFSCELIRNNSAAVECDEVCIKEKEERKNLHEKEMQEKKREEEAKNAKELEAFQKKFQGKKKYKDKKKNYDIKQKSFFQKYWIFISTFFFALLTLYIAW